MITPNIPQQSMNVIDVDTYRCSLYLYSHILRVFKPIVLRREGYSPDECVFTVLFTSAYKVGQLLVSKQWGMAAPVLTQENDQIYVGRR
jgi:hypothetical protein